MRALVLAAATAACAPIAYVAPVPTQVGCLAIAVTRVDAAVLEWRLANTCDHAVPFDLTTAHVTAIDHLFVRTPLRETRADDAGWVEAGETTFVRVAYAPSVAPDVAIDVELDAFADQSHRPVALVVVPAPPTASHSPVAAPGPATGAP